MLLLIIFGFPATFVLLVQGPEVQVTVFTQELLQLEPLLNLLAKNLEHPGAGTSSCSNVSACKSAWGPSPGFVVGPDGAGVVVEVSGKV